MKVGKHLRKELTMKCAICNGTVALISDDMCEFCAADMTYVELTYSEVS